MSKQVNVKVDAGVSMGVQEHLWRYIGYDECNYTYIPEGVELLKKFAALEDAPYYFRKMCIRDSIFTCAISGSGLPTAFLCKWETAAVQTLSASDFIYG